MDDELQQLRAEVARLTQELKDARDGRDSAVAEYTRCMETCKNRVEQIRALNEEIAYLRST